MGMVIVPSYYLPQRPSSAASATPPKRGGAARPMAAVASLSSGNRRCGEDVHGKNMEKPGEKRCGYLICYLPLFGKKSGGFGNVNGYEEYATWFNEFNVVLFPF